MKKIILWSCFVLLFLLPFVLRYFRSDLPEVAVPKRPYFAPIEELVLVHRARIKEQVETLKNKNLDETFVGLLESQQYFYPGYHPQAQGPVDMEKLLSTRSFLKVSQQFDELPEEQSLEKLREFCKRAIKDFGDAMENLRYIDDEKAINEFQESLSTSPPSADTGNVRYLLCASMLLAAHAGECELLVNQLNEMQQSVDACVDKVNRSDAFPAPLKQIVRIMVSLEDECILTVLMYALKRSGKDTAIPIEGGVQYKTIPLCRWDAPLTNYDFEVVRQMKALDPKDVVEQFDVYAFSGDVRFDPQKQKLIINTLKERLPE